MNQRECQSVFDKLSEYLDQELPSGDCEDLARHVQDCAPCVEFVESLKKSIALGRQYEPAIEPPKISPETRAALRQAFERSGKNKS